IRPNVSGSNAPGQELAPASTAMVDRLLWRRRARPSATLDKMRTELLWQNFTPGTGPESREPARISPPGEDFGPSQLLGLLGVAQDQLRGDAVLVDHLQPALPLGLLLVFRQVELLDRLAVDPL